MRMCMSMSMCMLLCAIPVLVVHSLLSVTCRNTHVTHTAHAGERGRRGSVQLIMCICACACAWMCIRPCVCVYVHVHMCVLGECACVANRKMYMNSWNTHAHPTPSSLFKACSSLNTHAQHDSVDTMTCHMNAAAASTFEKMRKLHRNPQHADW